MSMTAQDLIRLAMKTAGILGVGQTPLAEDFNDCFIILNNMLASWTQSRWLVYHLVDTAFTSTGAASYTVGLGGNFNVNRPDRIQSAYARLTTTNPRPVDYQLGQIQTYEEWGSVRVKSLTSFPATIFYDPTLGLGTIYFYPIPSANNFELHIITKDVLTQLAALTTTINLPPEYLDALVYSLAMRIQILFQLEPNPSLGGLAKVAINILRNANTRVPELDMPSGIGGMGGGWTGHGQGGFQDTGIIVDVGVLL